MISSGSFSEELADIDLSPQNNQHLSFKTPLRKEISNERMENVLKNIENTCNENKVRLFKQKYHFIFELQEETNFFSTESK